VAEALERWAALVRARRVQMEAQLAALGGGPSDWWGAAAPRFARDITNQGAAPPWGLRQIADRLDRSDTLIDIGGGAGRYAVPISRVARHVTLVEPSPAMAEQARQAFAAAGRDNYTLVEREWPLTGRRRPDPATAVLMANMLSPFEDIEAFLTPAITLAERWLFIVHGGINDAAGMIGDVIEEFHGERRVRQPGLADLIPALHDLEVYPDVEMSARRFDRSYADLDEATQAVAAAALVEPTADTLARIRRRLRRALKRRPDGRLAAQAFDAPVGLLIWRTKR
jgi:SAM-dependent methyltransferase